MGQGRPCGACRWQCAVYRLKRRSRLLGRFCRSMGEVRHTLAPRCRLRKG